MPSPTLLLEDPPASDPRTREERLCGADLRTCPECGIDLAIPHGSEGKIVYCPGCGQTVAAPSPIAPAQTDWDFIRPSWPFSDNKYPGSVGIVAGLAMTAIYLIEALNLYARLAALMFAGSLISEGLSRLRAEAERNRSWRRAQCLSLPDSTPKSVNDLGPLKAVFGSKNDWLESLAICFLALTFAGGLASLVEWIGPQHPKVKLALFIVPFAVSYLFYRAIRNIADRKAALVFSGGLVTIHGRDVRVIPRERIGRILCDKLDDAIDEYAVRVLGPDEQPLVRFTRCDFADLELLWQRSVQEFCAAEDEPADP